MTAQSANDSSVAVLGTGIMGSEMARNLVRAGLRTTVWDRTPAALSPLVDIGAHAAASAQDAVKAASVVITMLPTADIVTSVMLGDGVAQAFAKGAVWAQMGTIGVDATRHVGERLAALRPDVLFVDAPVSGSKGPASHGQLLVLASGPREAEPIVRRAFSAIGRKTEWLGETGQGSRMKLVVNAYMSILIEGVAEALDLADRLGLDAASVAAAIKDGPLQAPIADEKAQKMDVSDFAPEFPLVWALKDVELALALAGANPPPLLATLSTEWRKAVNVGLGRKDVSVARHALRQPNGRKERHES